MQTQEQSDQSRDLRPKINPLTLSDQLLGLLRGGFLIAVSLIWLWFWGLVALAHYRQGELISVMITGLLTIVPPAILFLYLAPVRIDLHR